MNGEQQPPSVQLGTVSDLQELESVQRTFTGRLTQCYNLMYTKKILEGFVSNISKFHQISLLELPQTRDGRILTSEHKLNLALEDRFYYIGDLAWTMVKIVDDLIASQLNQTKCK
jgi:hypothetical protein